MGCFVNLLPFRTDLRGDPDFVELLRRIRHVAIEAYTHQGVPVEKIVELILPERQLAPEPLTPVIFQLRNYKVECQATLNGLVIEGFEFDTEISPFDLSVEWVPSLDGFACSFVYKTELFDDDQISTMMEAYRTLLQVVAKNPTARLSQL